MWESGKSQIYKELQESDVFLLLSLSEGISGAAMEAMAHGLPVVATRVGGMEELVTEGEEGFLVPTRDPVSAADRLAMLVTNPSLIQQMSAKARLKIESHFTLDRTLRDYEKLYAASLS